MLTKELATTERIQPRFIEPMYAEGVRELPDGGAWIYEAKLDGYRCLAVKRTGGVTLWSRLGNLFTSRFPEIAQACDKLPADTLVDGEVVAIDKSGRASFNALQHSRPDAQLQYYYLGGQGSSGSRASSPSAKDPITSRAGEVAPG